MTGRFVVSASKEEKIQEDSLWDASLITGIPVIDEQHQALAACADKILKSHDVPLNSETGVDFLTEMTRLLLAHFSTEESILDASSLPRHARDAHIEAHTNIIEAVTSLNCSFSTDAATVMVSEIAPLIRSMVIDHVIEYDLALHAA